MLSDDTTPPRAESLEFSAGLPGQPARGLRSATLTREASRPPEQRGFNSQGEAPANGPHLQEVTPGGRASPQQRRAGAGRAQHGGSGREFSAPAPVAAATPARDGGSGGVDGGRDGHEAVPRFERRRHGRGAEPLPLLRSVDAHPGAHVSVLRRPPGHQEGPGRAEARAASSVEGSPRRPGVRPAHLEWSARDPAAQASAGFH